jgi:hypothetical protein
MLSEIRSKRTDAPSETATTAADTSATAAAAAAAAAAPLSATAAAAAIGTAAATAAAAASEIARLRLRLEHELGEMTHGLMHWVDDRVRQTQLRTEGSVPLPLSGKCHRASVPLSGSHTWCNSTPWGTNTTESARISPAPTPTHTNTSRMLPGPGPPQLPHNTGSLSKQFAAQAPRRLGVSTHVSTCYIAHRLQVPAPPNAGILY